MKYIFFVILLFAICSCNINEQIVSKKEEFNPKSDSIIWLFYAYTFNKELMFYVKNNDYVVNPEKFKSEKCKVRIDTTFSIRDTTYYEMSYWDRDSNGYYLIGGIKIYGFYVVNNIPRGIINAKYGEDNRELKVFDSINRKYDSLLTEFVRLKDTLEISHQLLELAKGRGVK